MMKRIAGFFVFVAMLMCVSVASAEGDIITVELGIFDYGTIVIPSEAKLELHSPEGKKVAEAAADIDETSTNIKMEFEVPEYKEGATYNIVATSGISAISYVGITYEMGKRIPLNTADAMTFRMEAIPLYKPKTGERADKVTVRLHLTNGIAFPSDARFFLCSSKGELLDAQTAGFDIGDTMTTLDFSVPQYYTGAEFYFVPVSGVVDARYYSDTYKQYAPIKLGTYAALDEDGNVIIGDSFDISLTVDTKGVENEYAIAVEEYINSKDIDSKTNYFIWVSKKDYKLNVLVRNNGLWDYLTSFDCTIGKPSTPTITGVFEYFQHQDIWKYDKYYVGPIMRFAPNGYAIHSTLVKYNGEPYDARLRGKLSLGCVRLAPENIKWLAESMPLKTRVYVTE